MIGFRNTLVNDYMDVDRTIVYEVLQNGRGDIEELKCVFACYRYREKVHISCLPSLIVVIEPIIFIVVFAAFY
jgi:hypothetical protein